MYASNRYDRDMLRVPQNYAGNAFPQPRTQQPRETGEPVAPIEPPVASMPEAAQETAQETVEPACAVAPEQAGTPKGEGGEGAREWLARLGIGQEELLLVGLLLLMRGEASEDISWLLLLLLALR